LRIASFGTEVISWKREPVIIITSHGRWRRGKGFSHVTLPGIEEKRKTAIPFLKMMFMNSSPTDR
jgi:hypothetical protein